MSDETKDVKREDFANIEEAIRGAGTSVLSHLGSRAHKLSREEVQEYYEENGLVGEPLEGEHRAYGGPYEDEEDERNSWTADQDQAAVVTP